MAIVGIQLTGLGLPAMRDATCMQVNALVDLPTVMMRAEMQAEGLDALENAAGHDSSARAARQTVRKGLHRSI